MLAIDHLFLGWKPEKLSAKVVRYSDLLEKVSNKKISTIKAIKAMKEATQEMPLVRKRMKSRNVNEKELATDLHNIIKNIFRKVMSEVAYYTDEEDFEKDFARL